MPRSRSRSRDRTRRRSRSRDRRSRSKDRKNSRRDRSRSRDRHHKRDRHEKRDRSSDRHHSSRHRDSSAERFKKRTYSRERHRDRSTSQSKKQRRTPDRPSISSTHSGSHRSNSSSTAVKLESIQVPNDESMSGNEADPRKTFEIANEFSREGFEQFTRDHGIDFSNIETEEDRVAVHEKMEEVLKAHFAAQGKIYPPPKVEKPAINAATGFANDGSFLEQFKKMQDDYKQQLEAEKKRKAAEDRLKGLPVRRRGGGKILKTGIVAKTKLNEDGSEAPAADPWSMYYKEVQKYKNSSCDSDSKTRPLVK